MQLDRVHWTHVMGDKNSGVDNWRWCIARSLTPTLKASATHSRLSSGKKKVTHSCCAQDWSDQGSHLAHNNGHLAQKTLQNYETHHPKCLMEGKAFRFKSEAECPLLGILWVPTKPMVRVTFGRATGQFVRDWLNYFSSQTLLHGSHWNCKQVLQTNFTRIKETTTDQWILRVASY